MLQIYFLSIFTNLLVGFLLACEKKALEVKWFEYKNVRLCIGIASFITGIVKMFVVASNIYFIGDFLPMITGIAGGFTLLLEFYLSKTAVTLKEGSFLQKIFIINKKTIGFVCLAAAGLHFIFPNAIFF